MTQSISSQDSGITYQIVLASLPTEEKPPNFSADPVLNPKTKVKSYNNKPFKSLSKSLFLNVRLATSLLIATIDPRPYLLGSAIGIAKPIYDWKFNKIVPKNLEGDSDQTDFGRMTYEGKTSYVLVGLLGPFFVAGVSQKSCLPLSLGIIGVNGYNFWSEATNRFIRWVDPLTS